jgi:sensor histidine kinase YesM
MNRLLDGLSWSGIALVAAFCGLASLEAILSPDAGVVGNGANDVLLAWLTRLPVFLVSGLSVLITAVVVFNAAGAVGRLKTGMVIVAGVTACVVASAMRYLVGAIPAGEGAQFIVTVFIAWVLPAAAFVIGYAYYLHARAAADAADAADVRRAALQKQQLETRMRLLHAQIEPHFLFNTLSNVRRLCQNDAAAGRAMLAQLTRYFRAALPRMRGEHATLGDEVELAAAYLGVQKVRMGARLQVAIDVPDELRAAPVPAMMLATLIENALKHGVGPLTEGGSIRIGAERRGDMLVVAVADTGRGFTRASGSGVGLANIRARLAALYGDRAALEIKSHSPRGVRAAITLPWTGR